MKLLLFFASIILYPEIVSACTIMSSTDSSGNTWVANNEDFFYYTFETAIKVVSKTDSSLGYIYFNYNSGKHDYPQGGINEKGLFFDINSIPESKPKHQSSSKRQFKGTIEDFNRTILSSCSTVPEAIELYNRYRVPNINGGQYHLADQLGNKGILTGDSAWISEKAFLISTNYNLCSAEQIKNNKCWRYPIAYNILKDQQPNLNRMTEVAKKTKQETSVFTNIHNLNTGEIWLFYCQDYNNPLKTSVDELLSMGDTLILFRELFKDKIAVKSYNIFMEDGTESALSFLKTNTEQDDNLAMWLLVQEMVFEYDYINYKISYVADDKTIALIIKYSESKKILSWIKGIEGKSISTENKILLKKKLKNVSKASVH